MENYTENSSELLHQMFDGELNPEMDDKLFSDLAQNPTMQTELNDMLKIRETISKDYEAFTPKEESKEVIFVALGFSKIATEVVATSIGAGAGIGAGFFAKTWIPISTALVASLVTALIVVGVYETKDSKLSVNSNQIAKLQVPIASSSEISNSSSNINSNLSSNSSLNNVSNNTGNNFSINNIENKKHIGRKSNNVVNNTNNNNNNLSDVPSLDSDNTNILNSSDVALISSNHEEMMLLPIENKRLNLIAFSPAKYNDINNKINIRNSDEIGTLSLISINPNPKNDKKTGAMELSLMNNGNFINTNNMSIGYNLAPLSMVNFLGSNIDIVPGIKLGKSEFMIAYNPENGVNIPSELKSIFYLAGQLRLEFKDMEFAGFTPIVQGQFGYSNGSISREMVGLAFDSPLSISGANLTFLGGYEYSQFNQSTVNNIARTQGFNLIGIIKF